MAQQAQSPDTAMEAFRRAVALHSKYSMTITVERAKRLIADYDFVVSAFREAVRQGQAIAQS